MPLGRVKLRDLDFGKSMSAAWVSSHCVGGRVAYDFNIEQPRVFSLSTMLTLALETSGKQATAALLRNETLLAESPPDARRSAQSLAPAIQTLLNENSVRAGDIDLVAVSIGPGSFTGLRVGVTTAKLFAWAVGAEVIGVNTLDAIAFQAAAGDFPLHAAIDAHRKQVFTAYYDQPGFGAAQVRVVGVDDWLGELAAGDTVASPMAEKLKGRTPPDVRLASPQVSTPMATSIGEVGRRLFERGLREELLSLAPQYYRQSAAEEKNARKL